MAMAIVASVVAFVAGAAWTEFDAWLLGIFHLFYIYAPFSNFLFFCWIKIPLGFDAGRLRSVICTAKPLCCVFHFYHLPYFFCYTLVLLV